MGVAKFGEPMVHTEFYGPDLGPDVHVGLFACAHNPEVKETATFTNVRIVVPPKAGWVPYRDYIGSNLEVMDVATGHRTVLHTSPISIQAPNWTIDGKTLIFNGSGKLWTFDLASKAVARVQHRLGDPQQQRPRAVVRRHDAGHQQRQQRSGRRQPLGGLGAAGDGRRAEARHRQLAVLPARLVARQEVAVLHRTAQQRARSLQDLRRRRRGDPADHDRGRRRRLGADARTASGSTSTPPAPGTCRSGG